MVSILRVNIRCILATDESFGHDVFCLMIINDLIDSVTTRSWALYGLRGTKKRKLSIHLFYQNSHIVRRCDSRWEWERVNGVIGEHWIDPVAPTKWFNHQRYIKLLYIYYTLVKIKQSIYNSEKVVRRWYLIIYIFRYRHSLLLCFLIYALSPTTYIGPRAFILL